jgi:hypothetical protein
MVLPPAKVRDMLTQLPICKLGNKYSVYCDHCPVCNLPLHFGQMHNGLLSGSLGHQLDTRPAGSSPDDENLHLDPLPLLEQDDVIKVALGRGASTTVQPVVETRQ